MSDWISIEERLPDIETGETIGVNIVNNGDVEPAYYTNLGDGEFHFHTDEGIGFTNVTHWQPLPNPPPS